MALSLDDRLLGEKTHYYCSSSEDEDDGGKILESDGQSSENPALNYTGHCVNTGPKGVVKDWQRYRQLETEKREEQDKERFELAKKLTLTCRTSSDDGRENAKDAALMEMLEEQFDEFEEQFLKEYRQKRLQELTTVLQAAQMFGEVVELNDADQFLLAVDKAPTNVNVIVHIYEKSVSACCSLNKSLHSLSKQYPAVKFCRIRASLAKLSINFTVNGLPTLLVYRNGELIGNFVRLVDEFGEDIHESDLESFLLEHGMLPDHQCLPVLSSITSTSDGNSSVKTVHKQQHAAVSSSESEDD